jgi:hypothetical protein
MIEGNRVWFWCKEGLVVGSCMLGTRAVSRAVRLVRFPLFCLVGLLSVKLAFSAAAHWVPTNFEAATNYAASDRGTISVIATEKPENDELSSETQSLKNKGDRQVSELTPIPNPSIGVEIVGGLALFLWVQRFRNSSV